MPSNSVDSALRERIYIAAEGRCAACCASVTLPESHCDHILPVEEGGSDVWDNLRCLCVICHKLRHGGRGYTKYERNLDCGCRFSVWNRVTQADAPSVLQCLKIKSPRRTRMPMLLYRCRKHKRMSWSNWLKLLGNPLPQGVPADSLVQLHKVIRTANDAEPHKSDG